MKRMSSSGGRIHPSIRRFVAASYLLAKFSIFAESEQIAFKAEGTITQLIEYPDREAYVKSYPAQVVLIGECWRLSLGHLPDAVAAWDRTNQTVLNLQTAIQGTKKFGLIHSDEVPHGGGFLRSLWFGLRLTQPGLNDGMKFPNLNSFEHFPPKTNTILRLVRSSEGTVDSASVNYLFDNKEYTTTVLKVDRGTNFQGLWLPVEFKVQTVARLGVELPPGQLTSPAPGITYTNILEEYYVKLQSIARPTIDEIKLGDVQSGGIYVRDERIGGTEFPLTYVASNQMPSEANLRSDANLTVKIRQLEYAQKTPHPLVVPASNNRRRLVILAGILGISAAGLFLMLRNARWRNKGNK